MTRFIFIILTAVFSLTAYSQTNTAKKYDKVIFNESLFNKQSNGYSFGVGTGLSFRAVRRDEIQDINNVVRIDNDSLKFSIRHGCGLGASKKQLITNGKLLRDKWGRNYYELKFLFTNYSRGGRVSCHMELSFDISELKKYNDVIYLKFNDFDQLIRY
ncbi:MAG: hypothetical protein PF489_08490 [Salinivirgaceae bacterium]|jgi:hypothetical protein|nr:hypothetical protein [Salinivirgaceae bacterium]